MIYLLIALCFLSAGCSFRSTYPTLGGVIGGSVGTLAGGPVAGGLSAGAGVLAGEALKNADALVEAEETIEALTHGDVSALVAQGMAEHKSGFAEFTSYIKRILIGAAIALGCYLAIPIFVAKRCAKTEVTRSTTRPPFPKPSDQK
jgi:hypothetical protein